MFWKINCNKVYRDSGYKEPRASTKWIIIIYLSSSRDINLCLKDLLTEYKIIIWHLWSYTCTRVFVTWSNLMKPKDLQFMEDLIKYLIVYKSQKNQWKIIYSLYLYIFKICLIDQKYIKLIPIWKPMQIPIVSKQHIIDTHQI